MYLNKTFLFISGASEKDSWDTLENKAPGAGISEPLSAG